MSTALAAALRLIGAAKSLPRWAWYVIAGALAVVSCWWLHTRAVNRAVIADRAVQVASAKRIRDSLTVELAAARIATREAAAQTAAAWASRDSAVARTRVAERATQRRQQQLASALVQLPDSLARIPAVDTVVRACNALAHDCEQLRADLVVERAAADTARAAALRETHAREAQQAHSDTVLTKATTIMADQSRALSEARGRISKRRAAAWYVVARGIEAGVKALVRR